MVTVCPSQFATRRTLFHVLVGCGLLMLKVSRLKLPVIWLLVSMWLNTLTKSQIWTLDRKSGSAGMPRPISYAVFCLKKKNRLRGRRRLRRRAGGGVRRRVRRVRARPDGAGRGHDRGG